MKRLKILIIIETEAFYLPAVLLVSKIISSLEQSAEFFYAKSFDEALQPEKERPMVNGAYDVIFMFANENEFIPFSLLDNLFVASNSSLTFFISTSLLLVEKVKDEFEILQSYVMNKEGNVSSNDFEKIKEHVA